METTVEGVCNAMSRCQFLPPEQIRDLRNQWTQEAGEKAPRLDQFTAWLIARGAATDYQIGVIARGNGSQLFVGPYRIMERVGRGRLAGVYKASHNSGAVVGVKILPPSRAAQPLLLARFQRELKIAVSVKHTNVIRSFHGGEHNKLHLVMEHLDGETLEDVLARRKRLPVSEAVGVIYQALLGLQAIHEAGLIHRDLKPGNLMLVGGTPGSTAGSTVKILDMGMGRALFDDEEGSGGFNLTQAGDMLGSADYMSPEQARDAHNADIRTDIYALGCILYQCLAGEAPFADPSPVRQLIRHASEEPKPITQHNKQVPDGMNQVLGWMMAKDPAKRYPTPDRAAQALQMFLAASGGSARQVDASMNVYLAWIDSLDGNAKTLGPAPTSAPLSPPQKKTVAHGPETVEFMPEPVLQPKIASHDAPRSYPQQVNVEVVEMPSSGRSAPPPLTPPRKTAPPPLRSDRDEDDLRGRRRKDRDDDRPSQRNKRKVERLDDVEEVEEVEEADEPARVMGMSPRELMVLVIGLVSVIGLAVLALIIWLVVKIVS